MIKIIAQQGKYCSGFRMRCITSCIIQWRLCNGGKFADWQETFYSQSFHQLNNFSKIVAKLRLIAITELPMKSAKTGAGRFIPGMSPINFDVLLHFVSLLIIPIKSFQNVYSTLESFEQSNIIKSRHSDSHPPVISLKT